jgi:hypothetical protein
MKKITPMALIAATVCLTTSCKDKHSPTPQYDNYTPLKVGNYWVYQVFDVDDQGYGPPLNEYDSCYISKDTVMNGNTYYYLAISPVSSVENTCNKWFRDSLHYVVDHEGLIYFSSEDFTNNISARYSISGTDTTSSIVEKMENKNAFFSTPAGNFTTSDCLTTLKIQLQPGAPVVVKYRHRRYAKNIGIVSETKPSYASNIRYKERRLLRYHLN